MTKPVCIDLYHGDAVHDFEETKDAGINFIFHKCTERLEPDPLYLHRRVMAKRAGILYFGAYHFLHGTDPVGEAKAFCEFAQVDDDLALAVDWEHLRDGSSATSQQAAQFCEEVLRITNRPRMWVYGGDILKERIDASLASRAYWEKHLLWLAQYGDHFVPPIAWGRAPDLWQNNGDRSGPGPHKIPGIGGYVDNSCIVNGTVDDLTKKWAMTRTAVTVGV